MPDKPQLSVIIASYNPGKLIESCLESLKNQNTNQPLEIIVVDSSKDGVSNLIKKAFPDVRLYQFSKRKFCGDARNFGLSVARGEIIAFIDADCTADPNWVNQILRAHQFPTLAIGGAIANGNPDSIIGWAAYLCEFSQWMPGRLPGMIADIAGANMSYKRETFEKHGLFLGPDCQYGGPYAQGNERKFPGHCAQKCLSRPDSFKGIPVQEEQNSRETYCHRLAHEGKDEEEQAREVVASSRPDPA